jgi:hypothetical protein
LQREEPSNAGDVEDKLASPVTPPHDVEHRAGGPPSTSWRRDVGLGAAVAMALNSVSVTGNALRLRHVRF